MQNQPSPSGEEDYVQPEAIATPAAAAPPVQKIVLEQPGGAFGKYGKFLFMALLLSIFANISQRAARDSYFNENDDLREKYHSGEKSASDKVAIITVEGGIMDAEGFIKHQIDQVKDDEKVKAVVLRINSPGGTVTASDYAYHRLKQMTAERKIPLVVSMGSLCASGGYYLAMAVGDQQDAIYAEPTTWTGSIGVIIPHYDASGLLDSWNVKDDSIASHKFKQLGSPTRMLSDEDRAEERAILQTLVDDSFEGFKDVVRAGRPMFREDDSALAKVATGQVFTANQALQLGLIDKIGFIESAIDRAVELAALPADKVRVVKYEAKMTGLAQILAGGNAQMPALGNHWDLAKLVDLTAPRAYYLSTWLPAVLTNQKP